MARRKSGSFASGINPELLARAKSSAPRNNPKKSGTAVACRALSAVPRLPARAVVVRAVVPGEGVSVNAAYRNVPGQGRVATQALKDWKEVWGAAWALAEVVTPVPEQPYMLTLRAYGDWESPDGAPRRRDIGNLSKADVL